MDMGMGMGMDRTEEYYKMTAFKNLNQYMDTKINSFNKILCMAGSSAVHCEHKHLRWRARVSDTHALLDHRTAYFIVQARIFVLRVAQDAWPCRR